MTKQLSRKPKIACPVCFLHPSRCICSSIPSLTLQTRIALIIHHRELKRPTNTGRLAISALINSEMRIRGEERETLDLSDLLTANYRTFLFYPSEDAIELNDELVKESSLPIQLIVPDGNWRQASKVHYRHHELSCVPRIKISHPDVATLFMRKETKESGMATLEAIAHALGVIEGADVKEILMKLYQAKLEGTLRGRGKLK